MGSRQLLETNILFIRYLNNIYGNGNNGKE